MSVEGKNISSEGLGPRKAGLSCAECRRSKLKCDRVFPCQSCIRRGCAGICPDGALTATKGNKVLMAHAEKLAEQVKVLTLRVQELESALTQSKNDETSNQPQVLEKDEIEIHQVSKAIGSLAIGSDGQAKYHGESAGSEYFQELLSLPQDAEVEQEANQLDLPSEIIELMNAFPFGLKDCGYSKMIFVPYLPPRERAIEILNIYFANVAWMYNPIPRHDFMASIFEPIYTATEYIDLESTHSHRLSVFFIALANGLLYDGHPAAFSSARQYQALSRAALALDSILQEATCATVQALFLMLRFAYNSDRRTNEERWLLTGLSARIAQTIGLQRDSEGWNLDPEEVQRRRRLFWELFTWDSWTAVVNGRPPALMIQHTDCQFPDDLDSYARNDGETELGWHAWKFRYSATCLATSVQHIFSIRTPPYNALLDIDKMIRRFAMPSHLRSPSRTSDSSRSWSMDSSCAMQQYCALCLRESNLLYIHRSYFAQAIRQDSENPLRHKFAPSVLATFRSACRLISGLRGLYGLHPQVTSQCWFFWSGIYSSCIVLGALVVESPACTLARDAMQELNQALPFYEEGSQACRPPNSLAMLQKLCQRAATIYNTFQAGLEDTKLRTTNLPDQPDELEVLGGRKSVITRQTRSNPPTTYSSGSPSISAEDMDGKSPASHAGAAEMLVEYFEELGNPSFAMARTQEIEVDARQQYPQQIIYYQPPDPSASYCAYPAQPSQSSFDTSSGMNEQPGYTVPSQHNIGQSPISRPAWREQLAMSYQLPAYNNPSGFNSPIMYGSYNLNMYQYPARHEQTQDDIWRSFLMEYSGSVREAQ
ncbi:hypothetical protein AMATHDRAFT_68883 [Amanita thiersii Skay4041]|uniref:Zn(2)-C6 fungal-type domain-containing protein n=1 Tax=Amanita thiersii Skay4041 TaxID=703135 RepID=A0A2A9N8T7_9AGAR|nr:hypothetical protein AMATHDRAFT_68883 [Amanita thiersii Skay4041]